MPMIPSPSRGILASTLACLGAFDDPFQGGLEMGMRWIDGLMLAMLIPPAPILPVADVSLVREL